jgi:hypothetical protein
MQLSASFAVRIGILSFVLVGCRSARPACPGCSNGVDGLSDSRTESGALADGETRETIVVAPHDAGPQADATFDLGSNCVFQQWPIMLPSNCQFNLSISSPLRLVAIDGQVYPSDPTNGWSTTGGGTILSLNGSLCAMINSGAYKEVEAAECFFGPP